MAPLVRPGSRLLGTQEVRDLPQTFVQAVPDPGEGATGTDRTA